MHIKRWKLSFTGMLSVVACMSVATAAALHSSVARATGGQEWVTAAASWARTDATGATFYVSLSVGESSGAVRNWGTDPPSSAFPMTLTNSAGDDVTISINGSNYEYEASVNITDVNDPNAACEQQACNKVSCYGTPGFAYECDGNGSWCWHWKCTSGGGGIDWVEVFSAGPI